MDDSFQVEHALSERDPYSLVVDALWALLEQDNRFGVLVRPGNRVKFTGDSRDPIKQEVGAADLPEVRIIMLSGTPQGAGTTSCSLADVVLFQVQVSSGDQRLDALHLPLYWVVFEALADATKELRKIEFRGYNPVSDVRPTATAHGRLDSDLNRGIIGWSALWTVQVTMQFKRSTTTRR